VTKHSGKPRSEKCWRRGLDKVHQAGRSCISTLRATAAAAVQGSKFKVQCRT